MDWAHKVYSLLKFKKNYKYHFIFFHKLGSGFILTFMFNNVNKKPQNTLAKEYTYK